MKIKVLFTVLLLLLLFNCNNTIPLKFHKETKVHVDFIDVKQGLCVLIRDNNGNELLYDTGKSSSAKTVIDYLDSLNIDTIETFVLSHTDTDHFGGMFKIFSAVKLKRIIWRNLWPLEKKNKSIYMFCDSMNIAQQPIFPEDTIAGINDCLIKCLWPEEKPIFTGSDSGNQSSIVLKLTVNNVSCMLTGDLPTESEKLLIDKYSNYLKAELLSAGHHGSNGANSLNWLGTVNPDIVVISCGKNNPYGHPGTQTMQRINAIGCIIKRTDTEGTVNYVSNGWSWYQP